MGSDDIPSGLDDTIVRPGVAGSEGPDPLVGMVLEDRYEVRHLLARGGMGAVYVGHDRRFETAVAVKFLQAVGGDRRDLERRFEAEAKVLARLHDPRILRPLSWGRTPDGVLFLVSELLQGQTLDDALRGAPGMPVPRLVRVLIDTCRGLSEAHGAGVIHRDLKPANLFLQRSRGGGETTRILDFGIAKITQESQLISGDTSAHTTPGFVVGTVAYMSPEQVRGEAVGPESDIYSLGVVAYRALTGRLPFSGEPHAVMMAHVSERPARFVDVDPELQVDDELETLVMSMLAKTPEARPRSASEVARRLERILVAAEPHSARRPSMPPGAGISSTATQPRAAGAVAGVESTSADSASKPKSTPPALRWGAVFAVSFLAVWIGLELSRSESTSGPPDSPASSEGSSDLSKEASIMDPAKATRPRDDAEGEAREGPVQSGDGEDAVSALAPKPSVEPGSAPAGDSASGATERTSNASAEGASTTEEEDAAAPAGLRGAPRGVAPDDTAADVGVRVRSEVGLADSPENRRSLERLRLAVTDCVRPGDAEVGLVFLESGRRTLKVRRPDGASTRGTEACLERVLKPLQFSLRGNMGMVTLEVERRGQ